jgi:Na+-driven multidrug efflux pump
LRLFASSPIIAVHYWAAIFKQHGRQKKKRCLTLSKQGFFLIPLVLILPNFLFFGVWIAFPIADILSTLLTGYFLKKEMNTKLIQTNYGIL